MQRVARKLATVIRHDAYEDRDAPGTLVRHSGRGASSTLAVYYAARPVAGAAYGGYELAVITRAGALTEVALHTFGQEHAFVLGGASTPEVWFDLHLTRVHIHGRGWTWVAGADGGDAPSCIQPPPGGQPVPCRGTAWARERSDESSAAAMLDEATQLIASARHHEPV